MGVVFIVLAVILLGYALYYIFISALVFYGIVLILIPGSVCLLCLYVGYRNPKNFGLLTGLGIFTVFFLKIYYPWATKKISNLGYLSKPFLASGETIWLGCKGMGHCQEFTTKHWRSEDQAKEACKKSYNGNGGEILRACEIDNLKGYCEYGLIHNKNPVFERNFKANFANRYELHYGSVSDFHKSNCKQRGGKWSEAYY